VTSPGLDINTTHLMRIRLDHDDTVRCYLDNQLVIALDAKPLGLTPGYFGFTGPNARYDFKQIKLKEFNSSILWSTGATSFDIDLTVQDTTVLSYILTDGPFIHKDTIQINSIPIPVVNAGNDQTVCAGTSVTLSGSGAMDYSWSGGVQNGVAFIPTTSGTYTVTGSNYGCSSTDDLYVTVNTTLQSFAASASSAMVCSGSSVVLTASGASTYVWGNGSTSSSITVNPTVSSNYTVTGTGASGCTGTATVSVGVFSAPVITAPTTVICSGAPVVLTSSLTSAIQWYKNGFMISGATAATYSATSAGTYTVKSTACSNLVSNGFVITTGTNPTAPSAFVQSGNLLLCGAGAQVVLKSTVAPSGTTGLQWYVNGTAISGATTSTYTATTAGSYVVRRVQLASGCTSTASPVLAVVAGSVPNTPVASIQSGSLAICSGSTSALASDVLPSASVSLQWYQDGVAQSGATAATLVVDAAGSFTVKAIDISGCASSLSNALELTVNDLPTISVSATPEIICSESGSMSLLMVSGADTYMWSDGSTLPTLEVSPTSSTIYTVVGTDTNGCSTIENVSVTVIEPISPIFTQVAAICSGDSLAELPTTSLNGIEGTWSPALNNTATTTYTFSPAVDECASPTTMEIIVNDKPIISASASPDIICKGSSSSLVVSGADTYMWSNGATLTALDVTPNTNETYTVVGTNTNGCTAVQEVSVSVMQPISPTFTSVPAICFGDSIAELPTTSLEGIDGTWSPALNNTATTVYTFTPHTGWCSSNATMEIVVNTLPTVTASASNSTTYPGSIVVLTASGASTYIWHNCSTGGSSNTVDTPVTVSPTSTTAYSVTGTDANGCTAVDTVIVTILTPPSITATDTTICFGDSTTLTATVSGSIDSTACPTLSGTLNSGLVGYWPFCGNANDASGNGNDGTVNGAALTTDRFGNGNSAYSFDGNDWIEMSIPSLPTGNNQRSISIWTN
jgi:hypothetical protein